MAVIIAIIVQVKSRKDMQLAWTRPMRTEMAHIEEIVALSGGGVVCLILLILHQLGIVLAFATTTEAIQQAAVGTLWIGGNTLWGIGIIVGRTPAGVLDQLGWCWSAAKLARELKSRNNVSGYPQRYPGWLSSDPPGAKYQILLTF